MSHSIASISFDRVPAPKGASVHISAFARALAAEFGGVELVTLGETLPLAANSALEGEHDREPDCVERWPGVRHHRLPVRAGDMLTRALGFRHALAAWWPQRFDVVHFRSIYEGYAIARNKSALCNKLVFEVNGLPSIELKYHHPDVADDRELLRKILVQEQTCLLAADLIITPSAVTKRHLVGRGVAEARIVVVPNGVDTEMFAYREPSGWDAIAGGRELRMLYAGTMSPWQGVRQAISALALYQRDYPARLCLVGPTRGRQRAAIESWCEELGVRDRVELVGPLTQLELALHQHEYDVILAPLLANDRNKVQGCCPLKVLEGMASGTPVIASDLEVVRELASDRVHAMLVKPGSGKAIKDALLELHREPQLAQSLARQARARVESRHQWLGAGAALCAAYREHLGVAGRLLSLSGRDRVEDGGESRALR